LDVSINPSTAYLFVKPGAAIEHRLTVKNTGLYTLELTPQLVDFQSDERDGQAVLQQSSRLAYVNIEGNSEKWGKSFVLKPNEEKSMVLLIAPPVEAIHQEHHLSILFELKQLAVIPNQQSQALISAIVASNLILLVSNDETDRSQLLIEELVVPQFVDSLMGFEIQATAHNRGLNAQAVNGELTVQHWPNPALLTWSLAPDMVLAGGKRLVRGVLKSDLEKIKQQQEAESVQRAAGMDVDQQKQELIRRSVVNRFVYKTGFLIGAYDVKLQIGEEQLTKRVIALPFSLAGGLLLLPMLLVLFKLLTKRFAT
jgi:hypothetical protein